MDTINIQKNLFLKQFNESNAIAYNSKFVASSSDYNFRLLDNAYRFAGKHYAKIKIAIESNRCQSEHCVYELAQLKQLEEAPQKSTDFLSTLVAELNVTEEDTYDPNNDFRFAVANSIMMARPGFSKSDGYEVYLDLLEDGSQQIEFTGPAFVRMQPFPIGEDVVDIEVPYPLIINNVSLQSLINSDTSLIVSTPDINAEMEALLPETGLFVNEMIENNKLKLNAKISEEFIMKNADGSFDYEIIDLGGGKGRNVLKFDIGKIEKKITPFINAEVAGLMSSEQDAVAAWNVYISKDTSVGEDDQMVQNANADNSSWSYELDLPLDQDKKEMFSYKYKVYFMNNYLKQFTKNQTPTVKEDAAVFDLSEKRLAQAEKFEKENNIKI